MIILAAAIGGLVGAGIGVAINSMALVVIGCAVVFSANLLPAVVDWRGAQLHVETIRQRNKNLTVIEKPVSELTIEREIETSGMIWIEPEQHRVH